MGLADLHIHTIYSYDGTASVPAVLRRAREIGLDVIAITDHDEITGSLRALELASHYGVQVIPGMEVTTAEGDLLALNVNVKIPRNLPLTETILRVGELGGFCIVPHPMAGGFGMRGLSAYSILKSLRHPDVPQILIAIETYNATTIDRLSNHYAGILAERVKLAQIGSSDAHVVGAIGLGFTEFDGYSVQDLLEALHYRGTEIRKRKQWHPVQILGSWAANYVSSTFTRLGQTQYRG
ncbi:MAG TPA: PHP domain-containing protein [Anaerolineales bacterium]|nr:PHP domain-containing protein [Anaerolineales bacterium]